MSRPVVRARPDAGPLEQKRIAVLFVMIQMAMGGTERLIFNLVRNLDRRVFEPSIAWFANERPLDEFADLQVPLHYVPKRKRFDWGAIAQIARIVRDSRIDVINAHHFMSFFYAFYGAKVANRARLVYTEHSEADVLAARGRWQTIGGYLLRSSDAAVGVSPRVSATLAAHFRVGADRIHTIENGVDVAMFSEGASDRQRLRRQFGLSPDDVVIGLVGNFRRNKNHLFLLKAFGELRRLRQDVRLVFVGQGFAGDPENSEPEAAAFIRDNGLAGSVRMLGYQANVQELLRMLDVSCLVSHKEGLPLSVIEAMASGLPVVGTDIEALRGVVAPEVNGLLVQPDDVAALTLALSRLAGDADLRRRMGRASRERAEQKYSLARCVDQTQALFASFLPERAVPLQAGHSAASAVGARAET